MYPREWRRGKLVKADDAVLMDIQQRDLKAPLFSSFLRVCSTA